MSNNLHEIIVLKKRGNTGAAEQSQINLMGKEFKLCF